MKKIIYLFVLTALFFACKSEPHFVLKGNIDNSDSVTFQLQKREAGKIVTIDSAISKKGSFKMTGTVEYPDLVQLVALNTPYRTTFYLENSDISIMGTLDSLFNAKISGSKTQDEYASLIASGKPLSEKYAGLVQEFQAARQANDQAKQSEIQKAAEAVAKEMTAMQKEFVKNNPSSYVTPSVLRSLSYEMEADEIEAVINAMDTNVAKIPVMKDLKTRVEGMKAVSIGKKAPDFTMNDVNGNPVSLSSKFGAKLLLVDFWAAWCGPCKMVAPVVDELAKAYQGKIKIAKMDVDQNRQTPARFGIRNIPTLLLFKGGEVAHTIIGAQPKASIEQELKKLL